MNVDVKAELGKPALNELLTYIDVELKAKTGEVLERAERSLSASWQEIRDSNKQAATRATSRWLKDNKLAIQEALHQRLLHALTDSALPLPVDTPESGDLNLMDEDALNVVVYRARMVHKVLERAGLELGALYERLTALRDAGTPINGRALDPGYIADGYLLVLKELGVPSEALPILMEIYSDRSVELLIRFYEGLNKLMAKLGILPNLKVAEIKAPKFTLVGDKKTGVLDAEFHTLQKNIESYPIHEWRHGVLTTMVMLPSTMVMSSIHEAAIDKVENFVVDMLKDERISLRVRHELSRLVATLVAISMDDPDRLDLPKGPIKSFIRQLSLLGARDQESRIEGFDRISTMVSRIVSERGHNVGSFWSGAHVLYTIARGEVQRRLAQRADEEDKSADRPH